MPIRFLCTHCKKVVSVKDDVAGKRGKCPHCSQIITVPAPAKTPPHPPAPAGGGKGEGIKPAAPPAPSSKPAAPPPPRDAEAEAAALLADGTGTDGAAAPSTIDFTCPMCDAELHLPLSEAGKRMPCPECKRIIKVPEPAKKDPANWRQTGPALPSGAKRAEDKAPEGAWGSAAAAALVSRESLQEAGAVPEKKAPVPLSRRIVRIAVWAGGLLFVVIALAFGFLKWVDSRQELSAQAALDYADSDAGKKELGADGRAAVYRLGGQYFLGLGKPDSAAKAKGLFQKSLAAIRQGGAGAAEHDALLQDLVRAEVEMGGAGADVDAGLKLPWDEVQKQLQAALQEIKGQEPRLEALREVGRRVAGEGQEMRVAPLTKAAYSADPNEEKTALCAVRLELLAAGKKGEAAPDPGGDQALQAEALARAGQWNDARALVQRMPKGSYEALRAQVALAAADLDDPKAGNADVTAALQAAPTRASPWLLLRLVRTGVRAKIAPETLQQTAANIADRDLRGRAQLAILEARLADPKQAGDVKLIDAVEAQSLSARLAHAEWAAHNRGATGVIRAWDAPNRAFGQLGIALGPPEGD